MGLPVETLQAIVNVLAAILVTVFGVLVACLAWFAIRVVNKLDNIERIFEKQMHNMDVRVSRLEAWKEGFDRRISYDATGGNGTNRGD